MITNKREEDSTWIELCQIKVIQIWLYYTHTHVDLLNNIKENQGIIVSKKYIKLKYQ